MKILALDLSTHTGFAVVIDGKPVVYGQFTHRRDPIKPYPMDLIAAADATASECWQYWFLHKPDAVVIEQTNQPGFNRSRDDQKILEFIHYSVAKRLYQEGVVPVYFSTSQWQKYTHITLTKEEREMNRVIEKERTEVRAKLSAEIQADIDAKFLPMLNGSVKGDERRAIRKEMKKEHKARLSAAMRRTMIGKGRKTKKHATIAMCAERFGLIFKQNENNIADAIGLGVGYHEFIRSKANERPNQT